MGKLINRIPGSRLLISSLASLAMSTSVLKALPGKLDIKRHSPSILYFSYISASILALKEEDLSKVPYLQYCMAEAVRLHPVGIITRRVVKEFTIRVKHFFTS